MGRPTVNSSSGFSSAATSSSVGRARTSHVQSIEAERSKVQPCRAGTMNRGVEAASILEFPPHNQLRNVADLVHDHLHNAHGIARFPHADNPESRLGGEGDERGNLLKLFRRKEERRTNFLLALELRVVRCSVNPIRTAAQLQTAMDDRFRHSRQSEQHITRSPGWINTAVDAVERKILVPTRRRGELLPSFHLL